MVKTKYRIRSNRLGYKWLEYRWGFIWRPVPAPYYSDICGREFVNEFHGWVGNDLEWFAGEYPDVKKYLKEVYSPEQEGLEENAARRRREQDEQGHYVKYLRSK